MSKKEYDQNKRNNNNNNNSHTKRSYKLSATFRPQINYLVETVYFTQNLCGHGKVLQETQLCNEPDQGTGFRFNAH